MKQKTGIILRRSVETDVRPQNRVILSVLALMLSAAWIGGLGSVLGLWQIVSPWAALAAASVVCVIWTVVSLVKRERLFLPGVLGLLLVVALVFGALVTDGACLLWNQISDTYTAGTGRLLPELQVTAEANQHGLRMNLCLILIGGLLSLLAIVCVQKGKTVTAVLTLVVLFVALLLFHAAEISGWIVCLLAVSVLLLLSSGWELRRKGQLWPVAGGAVSGLLACGLVLAVLLLPDANRWAENAKEQTAKKLHALRHETEYTALPEGELANYDNEGHIGYTALLVTMEQPEELYLRGFVGETYEDGIWRAASAERLAENKELLYWLQKDTFYPQTQYEAAAKTLEVETNRITVQNVNACSAYVYVPYALMKSGVSALDPLYLQSGALDANGSRSYSYGSVYAASDRLQELLTLLQEEEESILPYRQAESGYRTFVYEQNLQVPEDLIEQIGEELDACCEEYGSHEELTMGQAQDSALEFLSLYFGDQAQQIKMPLAHLQGTHYQYATVAAMALRYYGVPARYAEGFLISEELAEEGGQIAVDNSCGRAWVEVYQDGVGWLPMELTPGFEALAGTETEAGVRPVGVEGVDPNAEIGSEAGEGEGNFLTEGKEKDDKEAEENDTEDELSSGGTMMRIKKALKWTGILLVIAVMLLLLLVIARRIWLLRRKRQFFETGDLREALGWIYADSALFLSEMGLKRGRGSMDAVCAAAEERFGVEYGKTCREMKQLNDLVIFSNHTLEEEDRVDMLAFRKETLAYMKKHAKWYRKLWLQWIPCVY